MWVLVRATMTLALLNIYRCGHIFQKQSGHQSYFSRGPKNPHDHSPDNIPHPLPHLTILPNQTTPSHLQEPLVEQFRRINPAVSCPWGHSFDWPSPHVLFDKRARRPGQPYRRTDQMQQCTGRVCGGLGFSYYFCCFRRHRHDSQF